MNLVFHPFAYLMGSITIPSLNVNTNWFQNDGVVNTISQTRPYQADVSGKYDPTWGNIDLKFDASKLLFWPFGRPKAPSRPPKKGVYQVVGPVISGNDHLDVTGTVALLPGNAYTIFENAAALLSSTP
jgi:hypothetical protein